MTVVIGIDPGLDGALAVLVDGEVADIIDMPTYWVELANGKRRRRIDCAALEVALLECRAHCLGRDVPSIAVEIPQPRHTDSSTAAFSSGMSWGGMTELIRHLGWVVTLVRPQDWKADMSLTSDKEQCRKRAIAVWPDAADWFARKKDHDRAEAALIGLWWTDHNNRPGGTT